MTGKQLRHLIKKEFPRLSRKETRELAHKSESEIQRLIADERAEQERLRRERETNEDPLIKIMRRLMDPASGLKQVDGEDTSY